MLGTQEEAAEAYDIAAIKFRGPSAVTNFDMSRYDVESIANNSLPIGGFSSKAKNSSESSVASDGKSNEGIHHRLADDDNNNDNMIDQDPLSSSAPSNHHHLSFDIPIIKQDPPTIDYWSNIHTSSTSSSSSLKNSVTIASPLQNYSNNNNGSSVPFGLELQRNNNAFMDGGVIVQNIQLQKQSGSNNNNNSTGTVDSSSSSGIPLGTPIGLNSNSSYESSGYGNWSIGTGLHTFQTHATKGGLFQTPIFGME